MNQLFRKEVSDHARHRLAGQVVIATSISNRVLSGVAVLIVAIAVLFAVTTSYARKETVTGWLAPRDGLIRLTARQGGVISDIQVVEGQMVAVGQPVATVSLSEGLARGDSFTALSRSFQAQGAAAKDRAEAAVATLGAEQQQLQTRRAGLGRELTETRRRTALQAGRISLARAEVGRAETLASQGYLPRRDLEARRAALLSTEEEGSQLAAQALTYEREIGEVDARLLAIPIDIRAARADAASTRAGLDQQVTQAEAQSTYRVTASVAGRVVALPLDRGQTASPGAAVAVLTARDSPLEAELYAPSRAAGFVRPGQAVRLMYQAFPHQKFGVGQGQIISVSRTVLAPSEVAIPGLQVQEPVFRVRVRLDRYTVAAYGQTLPLQPGMLLTADVIIDRRSLLEWLLDPLYAAGRRT